MTVPLLSLTIDPGTIEDARRLARGLEQLMSEDADLAVEAAETAGEVVICCVSEHHLETVVERLKREFEVNAAVGRPTVMFREAVTRPAEGEAKYAKQTSGRGEYAHVKVRLYPGQQCSGCVFENQLVGDVIPARFLPSVEEGVRDALKQGVLAGYPIHDARIEISDGSYHEIDSTEAAFRTAACLATRNAALNGDPVVLEPVMRVDVLVPPEYLSDVVADLVSREGQIHSQQERGGTVAVRARVPLAKLFAYPIDLRERTRGRGTCAIEFDEFVPCDAADDDDRSSSVREPLGPRPHPRTSAIALPEPEDGG